nr:MAG TPA: hypothetical protein [Caudoviricetes sp.]
MFKILLLISERFITELSLLFTCGCCMLYQYV